MRRRLRPQCFTLTTRSATRQGIEKGCLNNKVACDEAGFRKSALLKYTEKALVGRTLEAKHCSGFDLCNDEALPSRDGSGTPLFPPLFPCLCSPCSSPSTSSAPAAEAFARRQ